MSHSAETKLKISKAVKALGSRHPMRNPAVAAKTASKLVGRIPWNKKYNSTDTERKCYRCGAIKPVSEFCKHTKGLCKHCSNIRRKTEYENRHRAEYNARKRKWYWNNVEKARGIATKWRRNNVIQAKAALRVWKKTNPEKYKIGRQARYFRSRAASGRCSANQWLARVEFYGWRCAYCRVCLTYKTLTQDHRIALINGGTNWPSNLVPACLLCNSKKGRADAKIFMARSLAMAA